MNNPLQRWRRVSPVQAGLVVSVWLVLFCNFSFWNAVWNAAGGSTFSQVVFLASVFFVAVLFVNFFLSFVVFPPIGKAVLILLLLLSAVAAYYMDSYGVVLDHTMIRNIFESDVREVDELLSWKLVAYVFVLGVLPSAWVAWVQIGNRRWWRELLAKVALIVLSVACVGAIVFAEYKEFASVVRNHPELKHLLNPTNYLGSVRKYIALKYGRPMPLVRIGQDARRDPVPAPSARKLLTVIVVGETARAANFALGGYGRPTNPQLGKQDIIYYPHVQSCGTSTAISLPCMFSDLGRAGFSEGRVVNREGLLDVLARAGFDVKWRDNNAGCKGACARTGMEDLSSGGSPEFCPNECYDAVLLAGLPDILKRAERDTVLVLHQKGSHGPSYYLRYPPPFEVFKPVCRTNQLETCTSQAIVNAYDNTILYTDHILSSTIDLLKAQSGKFDVALIYVSDHGESLGENGVYLHGLPWSIAPDTQKQVPMLFWMSEGFGKRVHLDRACLQKHSGAALSHDNLFHSVLGLLDVKVSDYRSDLDLFQGCRGAP
jgi:lipid A ethanolaminephosphotransferase